jgi:Na+/H+-dicarboxylate symporter
MPGAYFGIPLPVWVICFLAGGVGVGVLFPDNRWVNAIYTTGTYFPKAVVTFATLIIFAILSGATAKLVLFHRQEAGRLFGLILLAYLALGVASLVYVTMWIPVLTNLPLTASAVQAAPTAMSASWSTTSSIPAARW